MSTQATIPGLIQPTVNSYPGGANSPATAAKALNDSNTQKLHNINQMAAGSKRRKRGGGDVNVPVLKPIYESQNGPGTDPVSQQAQGQSINMQSTANNVYDNQATKIGGSRKKRRGGNPDWAWGCYSGGKRRSHRRKTKKHRKKTRRHRRH